MKLRHGVSPEELKNELIALHGGKTTNEVANMKVLKK